MLLHDRSHIVQLNLNFVAIFINKISTAVLAIHKQIRTSLRRSGHFALVHHRRGQLVGLVERFSELLGQQVQTLLIVRNAHLDVGVLVGGSLQRFLRLRFRRGIAHDSSYISITIYRVPIRVLQILQIALDCGVINNTRVAFAGELAFLGQQFAHGLDRTSQAGVVQRDGDALRILALIHDAPVFVLQTLHLEQELVGVHLGGHIGIVGCGVCALGHKLGVGHVLAGGFGGLCGVIRRLWIAICIYRASQILLGCPLGKINITCSVRAAICRYILKLCSRSRSRVIRGVPIGIKIRKRSRSSVRVCQNLYGITIDCNISG